MPAMPVVSWWLDPVHEARIGVLRFLAYAFIPLDVLWTTAWIASTGTSPAACTGRCCSAGWSTSRRRPLGVQGRSRCRSSSVSLMALAAALRSIRGRAQLLGWAVARCSISGGYSVGQSYGKVDHDRYGFLVLLFVLPTVGFTRSEEPGRAYGIRRLGGPHDPGRGRVHLRAGGLGQDPIRRVGLDERRDPHSRRAAAGNRSVPLDARVPVFLRGFQWFILVFEIGSVILLVGAAARRLRHRGPARRLPRHDLPHAADHLPAPPGRAHGVLAARASLIPTGTGDGARRRGRGSPRHRRGRSPTGREPAQRAIRRRGRSRCASGTPRR